MSKNTQSKQKQSRIPTKLKYAVLICDSFKHNHIIQSIQHFHCLSIVDEYPAIWYNLNWLAQNSVEEIFVLYSQNKDQIEKFFTTYQKSIDVKFHLNYIKPGELKNFGDAIRQVQFRNLVNDDFLILYGDTISNVDLSKMIQFHFIKKQQLKSVVLTTSFTEGYSKSIYILNSNTNQILQIQQSIEQQFKLNTQKINFKKVNIQFRRDIVPCEVYICTVEVLKSFKESYEYTKMSEFIVGMLTSEVYQQKINAYILPQNQKAFRSSKNAELYRFYMSYICNYLSPYTIHSQQQLQPKQKQLKRNLCPFSVQQYNKVIKHGSKIHPSTRLSNNVFIGQDTIIQPNCYINRSIILKRCKIGQDVVLQNCLVLSGCQIKSNGSKYEFCKFENIGSTMKISSFKDEIIEKIEDVLMNKDLYEETPNDSADEAEDFQQELQSLLKQQPNSDSVTDLFTLRKCHNRQLKQFTKQMVRVIQPVGVKGVQQFVQKWGSIILKLHQQQDLLLTSLSHTCSNIDKYNKALHIFLQFFYIEELLSKQVIKKWFSETEAKIKQQTMALCKPFLEKLDEHSEEEEQDQEDQQ